MTKISAVKLATFTAMTLVLSAPGLALAKAPEATVRHSLAKPLVKTMVSTSTIKKTVTTAPVTKTESGQVDTTANGVGSWVETIINYGKGILVEDKTTTFKDGLVVTSDDTITKNAATGSITSDNLVHYSNGKTVVYDSTDSAMKNGSQSITGTITSSTGNVENVSATKTKESYGYDTTEVITNAKGKTEDLNTESFSAGDALATVTTGTGFNGKAISGASLTTINGVQSGNYVDNSTNGQGSYTYNKSTPVAGQTLINNDKSFANGATNNTQNTISSVGNGVTNINTVSNYTSSNGTASSGSLNLNYVSNGSGTSQISGSFSQSNDHYGTIVGSGSGTNYGYATAETYTDQNGATKTANTQTLTIGDAVLNVNTGTTFTGTATSSTALVTGQQSTMVAANHPGE